LVSRGNELVNKPEPAETESSRIIGFALDRYLLAAKAYESLQKNENPPYRELFGVRIKIGDIRVRQNKYQDALDVYGSASELAQKAAATQRVVDWQIRLSSALEETGDFLASGAGNSTAIKLASGVTAIVFYQKALEVVDAAAAKEPDNQGLQSRRTSLTAKIKAQ
jgi:tetratricopeptide (TPR) repeat protein